MGSLLGLSALAAPPLLGPTRGVYLGPYVHRRPHTVHEVRFPSVNVAIALEPRKGAQEQLVEHLKRVSDVKHADYGKYLTREEVRDMVAPEDTDLEEVVAWVMSGSCSAPHGSRSTSGLTTHLSKTKDMLWVRGSVDALEQRFGTKLALIKAGERKALRAKLPLTGVPECAARHMSFISINMPIHSTKMHSGRTRRRLQDQAPEVKGGKPVGLGTFHARPRELTPQSPSSAAASEVPVQRPYQEPYLMPSPAPVVSSPDPSAPSPKPISPDPSPVAPSPAPVVESTPQPANITQVNVSTGTEQVLLWFRPLCADGSVNVDDVPCASVGGISSLEARISYAAEYEAPLPSVTFSLDPTATAVACTMDLVQTPTPCDPKNGSTCTCTARVGPLPMHRAFSANVLSVYSNGSKASLDESHPFTLVEMTTPALLRELYGVPRGLSVKFPERQGVAEFLGEFYDNDDLDDFFKNIGEIGQRINDTDVRGDAKNKPKSPGGEAMLDIEYFMALAPNATNLFYSFNDLDNCMTNACGNEGFLVWLNSLNDEDEPPRVHSLSYGGLEEVAYDEYDASTRKYAHRVDHEFVKLAARGITLMVSSGDDGVGSEFAAELGEAGCAISHPEWPTSSPWVTSVGATQLSDRHLKICAAEGANDTVWNPFSVPVSCGKTVGEVVCSSSKGAIITSGGGFSNVYKRPHWQGSAVDDYIASGAAPAAKNFYNREGRGYPDVAVLGSLYYVQVSGNIGLESGTSASSPVFAALVTLLNDARASVGGPPMGFINPWLYEMAEKHPEAFNDVTVGNNACAAGELNVAFCCKQGFSAAPGWDAVSGLGSPNFALLRRLAIASYMSSQGPFDKADRYEPTEPSSEEGAMNSTSSAPSTNAEDTPPRLNGKRVLSRKAIRQQTLGPQAFPELANAAGKTRKD